MAMSNAPVESIAAVFLRVRNRLARTVARIVPPNDVDDIVQETFLRCYLASARSVIRHPRSFMLTTAKNLALNHVAKADNRLVFGVEFIDDATVPLYRDAPTVSDHELRDEFYFLCRAMGTLPVQCRRAFVLKKVYGFSRKEIASRMGIAESTVQKHVAKGVTMCVQYRERLDPH